MRRRPVRWYPLWASVCLCSTALLAGSRIITRADRDDDGADPIDDRYSTRPVDGGTKNDRACRRRATIGHSAACDEDSSRVDSGRET